jgi:hypothetical protein
VLSYFAGNVACQQAFLLLSYLGISIACMCDFVCQLNQL